MKLSHALRLSPSPCLALVGAGGKTSALFQLARELKPPVIVTATTHLSLSQIPLADRHFMAAKPADLEFLTREIPAGVTLVTGPLDGERTRGVSRAVIEWLRAVHRKNATPLLIEADGSRQKPLKAPAEHEPPIPEFVETVVVVAGLSALGKPLDEKWIHRLEEFLRISASANGQDVTIETVAKALIHPQGGLKNIPSGARRVALLNQADTPELQAQAKALAEKLLPTYQSVLVASLRQSQVYAAYEPVAGIVLAAGEARRFGRLKQLLDFHGQPFVRVVAQTALAASLSPVVVVTGAEAQQVEDALFDLPIIISLNTGWQEGQSSSIRAGLRSLPEETGAAVFLLADQPQVSPTVLGALAERHAVDLAPIVAPLVNGRRANPVLFDCLTFPDLMALSGDVGGRGIFSRHPITYLPWHDGNLLIDVDTPEDLAKLETDCDG